MALYLTNIASMQAQRYLSMHTSALNTTMQRLASGLRINSAKDDPAGLQIANRMTSQINGLRQANRNSADAQALAATYEGALDETVNMLQKIRTLAVQASNGTLTSEDREAIAGEMNQLAEEITRIAEQTKFGGQTILLGEDSTMFNKGMFTIQVGAYAGDTITADFTQSFKLEDIYAATKQNGNILDGNGHFVLDSREDAETILGEIDAMIGVVDGQRGQVGALQVRLDSVMRGNENTMINVTDARSRIQDTDYAEEWSNYVSQTIRQQAAVSMLAMANGRSNTILQLLNASFIR